MNLKNKSIYSVGIMFSILMTGCFSPSDEVVKGIAYNYGNGTFEKSEIDILNTYEKEGKTVYMLDINGALCEMPVVKMKDDIVGTAFNCKGNPTSKAYLKKLQEEQIKRSVKKNTYERDVKKNTYERSLDDIGILYPLDAFTVNLKSDTGRENLKIAISLELVDDNSKLELDNKKSVVRDRVIRVISSKSMEEISSRKGKQKVTNQIIDTLNAMMSDGHIKGLYFTEFVLQ